MTVLTACQSAALRLFGRKPASVFSAADTMALQLGDLANETAVAIAKRHDWQVLTTATTITGDGVVSAFGLPADYDRMPVKADLIATGSQWSLMAARDLDQWLRFSTSNMNTAAYGHWIILGGQMQVLPVLGSGQVVNFYYVTKNFAKNAGGTPQAVFTADSDTFRLPERLLTLGLIWRWRQRKGLEYAEDMQEFEIAFAQEAGRERGSKRITIGVQRVPWDAEYAFPGVIVP